MGDAIRGKVGEGEGTYCAGSVDRREQPIVCQSRRGTGIHAVGRRLLEGNPMGRGATVGKRITHLMRRSPDRGYNELCGSHVNARWADENPECLSGVDWGGEEMR